MAVDMALLKRLRDATLAPLGDCKQALDESQGDFDQAQEILKKKWILKAGKKADRETHEWIVKIMQKNGWTATVKLLCETDFVAKNESFHEIADTVLEKILSLHQNIENIQAASPELIEQLGQITAEYAGKLGENIKVGDLMSTNLQWFAYNHPGNKVASLVYFEGEDGGIAKELALQVAAMNPTYCSFDDISTTEKNTLAEEYRTELAASGKPANIIEQIVDGKIKKTLGENVLFEQEYIRDGSKKVKDIIPAGLVITWFVRFGI